MRDPYSITQNIIATMVLVAIVAGLIVNSMILLEIIK